MQSDLSQSTTVIVCLVSLALPQCSVSSMIRLSIKFHRAIQNWFRRNRCYVHWLSTACMTSSFLLVMYAVCTCNVLIRNGTVSQGAKCLGIVAGECSQHNSMQRGAHRPP